MNKIFILLICIPLFLSCETTGSQTTDDKFIVRLDSQQIVINTIDAQYDDSLGLKKKNINVIYFSEDDTVALQYRVDFITYHQLWNKNSRTVFIEALKKYNEEYDERVINSRGGRRTLRSYGRVNGFLIWQLHAYTVRARANVDIDLGYSFYQRLPYYTVTQREAFYINPNNKDNNRTSQERTLYFTRAQAAELAAIFDQEFLEGLAANRVRSGGVNFNVN